MSDDTAAIRDALDHALLNGQYPASVFVPAGNYRRREAIALPNHACLFGEGASSILNSQNDPGFNEPILTAKSAAGLISARIQDLSLYGGSHGLRLDAREENADLYLHSVAMLLQTVANIEVNKLFQTVSASNCLFSDAPYGLRVAGTGTNCFLSTGSNWLNHTECSIFLRGADGVNFIGDRFEGGGRAGRACIDIEKASNVLFLGCFFENVHETLARLRHITGAVVFQSCHFSGTSLGDRELRAFDWDIGEETVLFRDCVSLQPMPVGGHVMLEGSNVNITARSVLVTGTPQSGRFVVQSAERASRRSTIMINAPSEQGGWRIDGQLTVYPGAGMHSVVTRIELSSTTEKLVVLENSHTISVQREGRGRWTIAIEKTATSPASPQYTFAWTFLGAGSPVVRASLT